MAPPSARILGPLPFHSRMGREREEGQLTGAFLPSWGWRWCPPFWSHAFARSSVPVQTHCVPCRRGPCGSPPRVPTGTYFLLIGKSCDGPLSIRGTEHGIVKPLLVPESLLAEGMSRPLQRCEEMGTGTRAAFSSDVDSATYVL